MAHRLHQGGRWDGRYLGYDREEAHGSGARGETAVLFLSGRVDPRLQVQIQSQATPVETIILPILHDVRFQLGFVSASQLVARLEAKASSRLSALGVGSDPYQLVYAWTTRRLRAGREPQQLVNSLLSAHGRLTGDSQKQALASVMADLGLLGRRQTPSEDLESPPLGTPSPEASSTAATSTSTLANYKKAKAASLPAMSASSLTMTPVTRNRSPHSVYSHSSSSTTSLSTPGQLVSRAIVQTSVADILSAMMTSSDPEDMRFILLDYLLDLRYRLSENSEDDWFLGCGRRLADEVTQAIEGILAQRQDVMGLQATFTHIRSLFDLPTTAHNDSPTSEARPNVIREEAPMVPPRTTASPFEVRERDASFDLEQYLADITDRGEAGKTEQERPATTSSRRASADEVSMLTVLTSDTFGPLTERGSLLSSFTIREAAPQTVAYQCPRLIESSRVSEPQPDAEASPQVATPRQPRLWPEPSQESLDSPYTRLPPRVNELRRRGHMTPLTASSSKVDLACSYRGLHPPLTPPEHGDALATPVPVHKATFDGLLSPPMTDPSTPKARRVEPATDNDPARRQLLRQPAIADGQHHSPSTSQVNSPSAAEGLDSKPLPQLPPAELPLASIISLFAIGPNGQTQVRSGVSREEVERIFKVVIAAEMERLDADGLPWNSEAKSRVAWLVQQVAEMVSFRSLSPLSAFPLSAYQVSLSLMIDVDA